MKNQKLNQDGIAMILEVIIFALVIAGVAFGGYTVYKNRNSKSEAPATSTTTTKKTEAKKSQTWQAGGLVISGKYADADVIKISDGKYRMYYASQPEGGAALEVYSSTSTDGKTWTKEAGTRKSMATFPDVVKLSDGKYRMYYQSAGVIKSAISSDGLSFTEESGTRIDKTNIDNIVLDNVAAPTVAQMDDGTYVMIYRGTINSRYASNTPNPTTQILLYATSKDGLKFDMQGIAIDSRNDTLNGQLDGPTIVKWDDGKYSVFATTYTGVHEFSFDGKEKFGKPVLALAGEAKKDSMGFHGSPPGDPTVIKIDDTWYMYYGGPREQNGIHYATLK